MNDVNIDLNLITYPLDMVKQLLGFKVYVKCRFNRELKGILHVIKIFIKFFFQAYDEHLNLMLSNVEETINKEKKRKMNLIFVRGDLIVLISSL